MISADTVACSTRIRLGERGDLRTGCASILRRYFSRSPLKLRSGGQGKSDFEGLSISECPFRNLPESGKGRWGDGLTAEDMKRCRWLKPQPVAAIELLEWTHDNHLLHPKFVSLRDDHDPTEVARERDDDP